MFSGCEMSFLVSSVVRERGGGGYIEICHLPNRSNYIASWLVRLWTDSGEGYYPNVNASGPLRVNWKNSPS